jgi:glycosyltransferase involved in cell wall biosynthesis
MNTNGRAITPSLGGPTWRRWRAASTGRHHARQTQKAPTRPPYLPGPRRSDHVAVAGLSAIVIAQDEAERIECCLRSCLRVASEVVVVDGGSSDPTPDIARELGCTVIQNPWPGYAAQRQIGVEHATKEWVLFVDADEEVTVELADSIRRELISEPIWDAYAVVRLGDFLGRWMSTDRQVRLCKRAMARYPDVLVHEKLDIPAERVGSLSGLLLHRGFRSVSDHVRRFDRYTTLEAEGAWIDRRRPSILRLLARPPARLAEQFAFQGLWRKGISGVAVSGLWAYYEFLRELKLFELASNERERRG